MVLALFPGQGSQATGMGRFLYDEFSFVKHRFEEASDLLKKNMKSILFDDSQSDKLNLTENTQPAILLTSVCYFEAIKKNMPLSISAGAGHSVGEFGALVTANILDFGEALKAVQLRGQYMQESVELGKGAMVAAMGLSPAQAQFLCQWVQKNTDGILEPANYNSPGQIVLSGESRAVSWLKDNFKAEIFETLAEPENKTGKVKFIPLKVSAPFHCSMMKKAQDMMDPVLKAMNFQQSTYPVVQNYQAKVAGSMMQCQQWLLEQISSPVLWVDCVEALSQYPHKMAVEFGHGKVAQGLVKKIKPDLPVYSLNNLNEFKNLESTLSQ